MVRVAFHGHVIDVSTDASVEGGRACLTSGDALVAGGVFGSAGDFRLEADVSGGVYHALVLDGWRRRIDVAGEAVDIDAGTLRLRPRELAPGVHGQAWDVVADRPAPAGRIFLCRGEKLLANALIGVDGWFSFDLTCRQPLPPGVYSLVPEINGYTQDPVPLSMVERVTVYQLGRLDLWAPDPTAQARR